MLKVAQQFVQRFECVFSFDITEMPMVPLATFVVVAHAAGATRAKLKAVLVQVGTGWHWLWQQPHHDLHHRPIVPDFFCSGQELR